MPELNFQDIYTLKAIRVSLKEEMGEKLQFADPELYRTLESYWHRSNNPITKSQIRSFLNEKKVKWNDPLDD